MTGPADAITVEDVTVRYRDVLALDGVSVRVAPGRVCGLVGMNGSGKSTLFKAIMGLVRPEAGTVRLLGDDPAAARRAGAVAYVPQHEAVDWSFPLAVRDVVMLGRYGHQTWRRRPSADDHRAVAAALERVHLTDLADRQIGRLSGGQRRRTFVARGIAQEARVLLLDEPFTGVDRRSETTVSSVLRELAGEGRSVLVSSHDLVALPRLCDDAVLLHQRVLAHGSAGDVLRPEQLARVFGGDRRTDEERSA